MSVCNCPYVGVDGPEDYKQKQLVAGFLKGLTSDGKLAKSNWSLLSLLQMAQVGNSMTDICSSVPFRGGACSRSMRCCGMCTRQCKTRCVQDCLHRLYMWNKLVESTPSTEREKLPLNIRLIVNQSFESHEHLSWVVGDILSQNTNKKLKAHMVQEGLRPEENPYKIDYAPSVEIDFATGKRKCDPVTGELSILAWPKSGLCPFCLPSVTVDGRIRRKKVAEDY